MYHYDRQTALEEITEEAILQYPHTRFRSLDFLPAQENTEPSLSEELFHSDLQHPLRRARNVCFPGDISQLNRSDPDSRADESRRQLFHCSR